jgi:hypothetical protein
MGAINLFGLHASGSFSLLLSINRFIQIVFTHRITQFFGKKTDIGSTILLLQKYYWIVYVLKIYIIVVWLTSAPIAIISLNPFITSRYYPYWSEWEFMTTNDRRMLIVGINNYLTIAKISVSAVFYVITIISMIYQVSSYILCCQILVICSVKVCLNRKCVSRYKPW